MRVRGFLAICIENLELPKFPVRSGPIILAGDIATEQNGLPWMKDFCGNIPTAFGLWQPRVLRRQASTGLPSVFGKQTRRGQISACLKTTLFPLGNGMSMDAHFGPTWHFMETGTSGAAEANSVMNRLQKNSKFAKEHRRLSATDTRNLHLRSVELMRQFLESHDPRRVMIITHHAPSILSLPFERRNEAISCAYASNLDTFIEKHRPAYWVHGHIHHNNDYVIGSTRVLANPQAYPMEINEGFIADLIVDI